MGRAMDTAEIIAANVPNLEKLKLKVVKRIAGM